jgi:hypothetical protein
MPKLANLNKPAGYAFSRRIGYIALWSAKKNALVADLYDRLGLRRTYENGSVTSYVLEPLKVMKPPSWISVEQ